jgi:hypothetical protein
VKPLFIMSLICVAMSLLALFGLSAMTIVARPGAESIHAQTIVIAGAFAVAWLGVAFWARPRQGAAAQSLPPQWLRRSLVVAGAVYVLGVFVLVIG